MTFAERRKKLDRPLHRFNSPSEDGAMSKANSRLVLSPTTLQLPGRSQRTEKSRRELQHAACPQALLKILHRTIKENSFDPSVYGAAMQRCGQGRWWDTMEDILELQTKLALKFEHVQLSQCLTSLTRCARDYGFDVVPKRQQKLLMLARQCWSETIQPHDEHSLNVLLSAALRLALAVEHTEGLQWGQELWKYAITHTQKLDSVSYESYTQLLAAYGFQKEVDDLLAEANRGIWVPSVVLLGALVNLAGKKRDWQLAEDRWATLAADFAIKPNGIAYGTRLKAHMLCGRPSFAARTIDEMLQEGIDLHDKVASGHLQALLIVYHSSLSKVDRMRMEDAIQRGTPLLQKSSSQQKRGWEEMRNVAGRLSRSPRSVRFYDVLVELHAKQSVMAEWQNFKAGCNYLRSD